MVLKLNLMKRLVNHIKNLDLIIYIINNLLLNKEVISNDYGYYIYMGLNKPDILLPEQTKYLIDYGILEHDSGNFETGDFSYILAPYVKIKYIIDSLDSNKIDKESFTQAIRCLKLSKLEI